jgi:hypothetical protein
MWPARCRRAAGTRRVAAAGRCRRAARRERGEQPGDRLAVQFGTGGGVLAEGGERIGGAAGPEAQLHPPAGDRIEHGGVLRDPDRILQRGGDDARGQPDPGSVGGHPGQEHQRRRQPALLGVEVVLRDPADVEAEPLGLNELLSGVAVHLCR